LQHDDRPGALALYEHALSRAGDVPGVLMMVTADLGNPGALEELARLGLARYEPERHGRPQG
jgi:hypothetical protein